MCRSGGSNLINLRMHGTFTEWLRSVYQPAAKFNGNTNASESFQVCEAMGKNTDLQEVN